MSIALLGAGHIGQTIARLLHDAGQQGGQVGGVEGLPNVVVGRGDQS